MKMIQCRWGKQETLQNSCQETSRNIATWKGDGEKVTVNWDLGK
jgi:hypothetical protein